MGAVKSALQSTNWYRVAELHPRLRGHVQIHRPVYRGEVWYAVEDRVGARFHRFNPTSYRIVSLMDGKRSMGEIWERLTAELRDDTPSQEEVVSLLSQLHASDLIQCEVSPDVAELFERRAKHRRRQFASRYLNPIALRFRLFDPDPLLRWLVAHSRGLAGWTGAALWLAVVVPALLLVPMHWPDLTQNFTEQLLSANNLIVFALVFPLIKALHELGHGYACRLRGAEVHEMGLMLLVLFPVPYVDASGASVFASKWQRILVGAAGMLTEVFVAAGLFYLWLLLEPGAARSVVYNGLVMASVTTVVFNANPLLRYDGYYMLADWAEIPNLATRGNRYWAYLADRYLFGVPASEPPYSTRGERRWFIGYAPLAFVYRIVVVLAIALFLAQEYFFVGVLLAAAGIATSVLWPVAKALHAVFTRPRYAARAARVRMVLAGLLGALGVLLFAVPLPYHSQVQGVVWLPEQAILRTAANGFVDRVASLPGSVLRAGDVVLVSRDPVAAAGLAAQSAKVEEVDARYDAVRGVELAKASQIAEELRRESAALQRLERDVADLALRAGSRGTLVMEQPLDLPGRYLRRGEVVGYLIGEYTPIVRGVVPQDDVDRIRADTLAVEVRFAHQARRGWPARLARSVPKAAKELPSAALGERGGGPFVVDPGDEKGQKTLESLFEFDLELPAGAPAPFLGSRAYVRFEHSAEPLGMRGWRELRRLFLSRFEI